MTSYTPKGVCSRQINIEVNGDTIESVQFVGGCNGNTQGISSLVKGMKVDEVIALSRESTATAVELHVRISSQRH